MSSHLWPWCGCHPCCHSQTQRLAPLHGSLRPRLALLRGACSTYNRPLDHCRGILGTWCRVAVEFNTKNVLLLERAAPHQIIRAAYGHHSGRPLTNLQSPDLNSLRPNFLTQWPKRFVQCFRYLENQVRRQTTCMHCKCRVASSPRQIITPMVMSVALLRPSAWGEMRSAGWRMQLCDACWSWPPQQEAWCVCWSALPACPCRHQPIQLSSMSLCPRWQ